MHWPKGLQAFWSSVFLRVNQNVDLTTAKVFAVSLIALFWFFSLMMCSLTYFNISLDLIKPSSENYQMQAQHLGKGHAFDSISK